MDKKLKNKIAKALRDHGIGADINDESVTAFWTCGRLSMFEVDSFLEQEGLPEFVYDRINDSRILISEMKPISDCTLTIRPEVK